jgi:hypothetical protein
MQKHYDDVDSKVLKLKSRVKDQMKVKSMDF